MALPASGRLEVFARRSMAGLAPGETGPLHVIFVEPGVRAVRKKPRDISVAIDTRLVADERGASISGGAITVRSTVEHALRNRPTMQAPTATPAPPSQIRLFMVME